MKTSQQKYRGFIILLIAAIILGASGCKSSRKAKEAAAAKARMEQEAADRKQKEEAAMREAELKANTERANQEMEERLRKAEEAKAAESAPASQKLEQYFSSIANSTSANSANSSINEALTMFSSDQSPVLIVISEEGGQKDFDKPTTIKAYLNYLKDQRKNSNRISNVELDANGKIKVLELVKH